MSEVVEGLTVELDEWDDSDPLPISSEDEEFVSTVVNETGNKLRVEYLPDGEAKIHSNRFVGVVSLPSGLRIEITPKAAAGNLLYLLRYSANVPAATFDQPTHLTRGANFLDIIAQLFIDELQRVLQRGISRSYENTHGNEPYLKGKLLIREQFTRHLQGKIDFACEFDDFTADTLLNQAILSATVVLSELATERGLKRDLQGYRTVLRRHVTERPVRGDELDAIELTRLNDYYEQLLRLTELVLDGTFIETLEAGYRDTYSILLNMDRVFESAIARSFTEVVEGRPGWEVYTQTRNRSLITGGTKVTLRPDILLRFEDAVELVADTKWKLHRTNSDLYQMVSYQLAYDAPGALIYPTQQGEILDSLTVDDQYPLDLVEIDTRGQVGDFDEFCQHMKDVTLEMMIALVGELK